MLCAYVWLVVWTAAAVHYHSLVGTQHNTAHTQVAAYDDLNDDDDDDVGIMRQWF